MEDSDNEDREKCLDSRDIFEIFLHMDDELNKLEELRGLYNPGEEARNLVEKVRSGDITPEGVENLAENAKLYWEKAVKSYAMQHTMHYLAMKLHASGFRDYGELADGLGKVVADFPEVIADRCVRDLRMVTGLVKLGDINGKRNRTRSDNE